MKSFVFCVLAIICMPILFMVTAEFVLNVYLFTFIQIILSILAVVFASIGLYYNIHVLKVRNILPYSGAPLILNIVLLILLIFILIGSVFIGLYTLEYGNVAYLSF